MSVIQQAATLPILRPLVGMDQQEIIDQARRIGTFDISAIPDQDCCELFVPKHPATKARFDEVSDAESNYDAKGNGSFRARKRRRRRIHLSIRERVGKDSDLKLFSDPGTTGC